MFHDVKPRFYQSNVLGHGSFGCVVSPPLPCLKTISGLENPGTDYVGKLMYDKNEFLAEAENTAWVKNIPNVEKWIVVAKTTKCKWTNDPNDYGPKACRSAVKGKFHENKTMFQYQMILPYAGQKTLLAYMSTIQTTHQWLELLVAMKPVYQGVVALACNGLIHRDLAARNVMINMPDSIMKPIKVRIIDVGLMIDVSQFKTQKFTSYSTLVTHEKDGKRSNMIKFVHTEVPCEVVERPEQFIYANAVRDWARGVLLQGPGEQSFAPSEFPIPSNKFDATKADVPGLATILVESFSMLKFDIQRKFRSECRKVYLALINIVANCSHPLPNKRWTATTALQEYENLMHEIFTLQPQLFEKYKTEFTNPECVPGRNPDDLGETVHVERFPDAGEPASGAPTGGGPSNLPAANINNLLISIEKSLPLKYRNYNALYPDDVWRFGRMSAIATPNVKVTCSKKDGAPRLTMTSLVFREPAARAVVKVEKMINSKAMPWCYTPLDCDVSFDASNRAVLYYGESILPLKEAAKLDLPKFVKALEPLITYVLRFGPRPGMVAGNLAFDGTYIRMMLLTIEPFVTLDKVNETYSFLECLQTLLLMKGIDIKPIIERYLQNSRQLEWQELWNSIARAAIEPHLRDSTPESTIRETPEAAYAQTVAALIEGMNLS